MATNRRRIRWFRLVRDRMRHEHGTVAGCRLGESPPVDGLVSEHGGAGRWGREYCDGNDGVETFWGLTDQVLRQSGR